MTAGAFLLKRAGSPAVLSFSFQKNIAAADSSGCGAALIRKITIFALLFLMQKVQAL